MTDDLCGEPTATGDPCQRPEGFGRDADSGPCMDHIKNRPVLRKFTAERRERIIGAAPSGAFKKHIAQMAEIDPDTLDRWLQMGEEDETNGLDTELAEFYTDWQRARGLGAIRTLNDVSPEFLAERAYDYTKTERREHAVDEGAEMDVTIRREPVDADEQ